VRVTDAGEWMHALARRLWPLCRSITGDGVRQTLAILKESLPELTIHEIPTGTKCFDWTVPKEWVIRSAYLIGPDGRRIVDFADNNLHIVNYSSPIDRELSLDELQPHLHSLPSQPHAIPYVTSYYKETWGFCLTHAARERLVPGRYRVRIDSELKSGALTYGEIRLPGRSAHEVLLSTYVCHPSMANNELSGPVVSAHLALWLRERDRRYSYRVVFVPETIGAICYLSRHLEEMKASTIAGYVITCVGDERAWSLMPSRRGDTLSDKVARHTLKHLAPQYKEYSFLERGSDERQYCSPGVDLPIASIMRSKYVTYPEYHTSLDDLKLVTARGLSQALEAYQKAIDVIEGNCVPLHRVLCEPKMSDRGLRPTLGMRGSADSGKTMMNLLAYADGSRTLLDIAEIIGTPAWELRGLVDTLVGLDLLSAEEGLT
jgi:aminopeptidase-like protein